MVTALRPAPLPSLGRAQGRRSQKVRKGEPDDAHRTKSSHQGSQISDAHRRTRVSVTAGTSRQAGGNRGRRTGRSHGHRAAARTPPQSGQSTDRCQDRTTRLAPSRHTQNSQTSNARRWFELAQPRGRATSGRKLDAEAQPVSRSPRGDSHPSPV